MTARIGAGHLRERVAFDAPKAEADGTGGYEDGWREILRARANFRYLRGGETVQAARLEGQQIIVVTVRSNSFTRAITADWRMRDLGREQHDEDGALIAGEYAVTAPPVLTDDRLWLEITVQSGRAS